MSNELLKGSEKRILGGIALAAVVILTYMFVVAPMNEKRARTDAETAEINKAYANALSKIRNIETMKAEFSALSNEIFIATNNYVVRKVLGSYPMEQNIYALADEVGFHVTGCVELPKVRTPDTPPIPASPKGKSAKKGKAPPPQQHRYDRFEMEVRGTGSYQSLMNLIHLLEEQNPFFGVTSLDISAVPGKPESHNISFKCEWPVDADKPLPPKKK